MNPITIPLYAPVEEARDDQAPRDELALYRTLAREGAAAEMGIAHLRPGCWTPEAPGEGVAALPPALRDLAEEVIATGASRDTQHAGAGSGAPAFAFLGVPVGDGSGVAVGCLAVAARAPRPWTARERRRLEALAELLGRELKLRREARELRERERLARVLDKALENMQLGVTVTDMEGRIVYTNPAEARMHGYGVEELLGRPARIFGPADAVRPETMDDDPDSTSWTRETVNVRRDGSRFPVLLWSDRMMDASGACVALVTCCEDITERKRAERALREGALRDPLTALPNRGYFLERLTEAMGRDARREDEGFAVLFLDLDRFKVVNDSLGHHVGDRLLQRVAERLRSCVRPADTVARFGGDEFAVLLDATGSLLEATAVAERIQAELGRPIQLDGYELFTSASIGIVMGAHSMEQPEYLWRSADMAMYRAKAAGKGRYEVFTRAMHADALARLQLETDLRRGLERREFELYYQPVVDLGSGRLAGFEALLRWQHPLRGMVGPAEAIPVAEETGLILPIGEWVLQEAARQLARWRAVPGGAHLWLGVNLSSKQLSGCDLPGQVRRAVEEAGIPAGALKLEITESAVVENTESASAALAALKELGVQLYMDDFGTGYSSLSYLHRLPLDAIKIDRSFVSRMERADKHQQLVESIVNLARGVRLRVVAEGVSTPEQLAILRELGCDLGQGYLFAPPLPPAEAEALLQRERIW